MGFWNEVGTTISKTVDTVIEMNRKAAQNNRLRLILKNETDTVARAYIALGKHYYNNMRTPDNEETECLCQTIDHAKAKISKVKKALDQFDDMQQECDTCNAENDIKTKRDFSSEYASSDAQSELPKKEDTAGNGYKAPAPFAGTQEAADEADELIPPLTDLDIQD